MGRALLQLIEALVMSLQDLARVFSRIIGTVFHSTMRVFEFAFLPETLLYLSASWVLIGTGIAISYVLHTLLPGRAVVFVSYHHDRIGDAKLMEDRIVATGMRCEIVEFDTEADHDRLLDQIMAGIRACDLMVCLPGNRESFVDNEVFAAASMKKPIVFCLTGGPESRLPNTAKKGYPIVASPSRDGFNWNTFLCFCAYVAGDTEAKRRIHAAVADYLGRIAWLLLGSYLISAALVSFALSLPSTLDSAVPFLLFGLLNSFFVGIPTVWFFSSRFRTRAVLRNVVANRLFAAEFVPKTMDSSLTRSSLFELLVLDEVPAVHQQSPSSPDQDEPFQGELLAERPLGGTPNRAVSRQTQMASSDPKWMQEAANAIRAAGDDPAVVQCPSDLIPEDLNPNFDWVLVIPNQGTAILVARDDKPIHSEGNGGIGLFIVFWILWIAAVFNIEIDGSFELILVLLGVIVVTLALGVIGSLLATWASAPERPIPGTLERKIDLPDSIWTALYSHKPIGTDS